MNISSVPLTSPSNLQVSPPISLKFKSNEPDIPNQDADPKPPELFPGKAVQALGKHTLSGNLKFVKLILGYKKELAGMKKAAESVLIPDRFSANDLKNFLFQIHKAAAAALNAAVALGKKKDTLTVQEAFETVFKALGAENDGKIEVQKKPFIMGKTLNQIQLKAKASGIQSNLGTIDDAFAKLKEASNLNTNFVESLKLIKEVEDSLY